MIIECSSFKIIIDNDNDLTTVQFTDTSIDTIYANEFRFDYAYIWFLKTAPTKELAEKWITELNNACKVLIENEKPLKEYEKYIRRNNMKTVTVKPNGWACTYSECSPGFFMFNGSLCLKSEYTTEGYGDAYCDSGEYFWGGTSEKSARDKLIVQPVSIVVEES